MIEVRPSLLVGLVGLVLVAVASGPAIALPKGMSYCVKNAIEAKAQGQALGIAPAEAETLIADVANSISLGIDTLMVVPCDQAEMAYSYYEDGTDQSVPKGEYIVYEPTWIRQVIGSDRTEAIVVFGHELGHLLNRDFTANSDLPRIELETRADQFAGCAAAKMGGQWTEVVDILSRLRGDTDGAYPGRERSVQAAQKGFAQCGGDASGETYANFPHGAVAVVAVVQTRADGSEVFLRQGSGFLIEGTMSIATSNNLVSNAADSSYRVWFPVDDNLKPVEAPSVYDAKLSGCDHGACELDLVDADGYSLPEGLPVACKPPDENAVGLGWAQTGDYSLDAAATEAVVTPGAGWRVKTVEIGMDGGPAVMKGVAIGVITKPKGAPPIADFAHSPLFCP
jgi:hypothetical protein